MVSKPFATANAGSFLSLLKYVLGVMIALHMLLLLSASTSVKAVYHNGHMSFVMQRTSARIKSYHRTGERDYPWKETPLTTTCPYDGSASSVLLA
jgi:hypothetical protein